MMNTAPINDTRTAEPVLIETRKCDLCGACVGVCPPDCIVMTEHTLKVIGGECILCGLCVSACPVGALKLNGSVGDSITRTG